MGRTRCIALCVISLLWVGCGVSTGKTVGTNRLVGVDMSGVGVSSGQVVEAHLADYDRNVLRIRGYMNDSSDDAPRLYPSLQTAEGFRIEEAIDLFPEDKKVGDALSHIEGVQCVVVGGTFRAYTKNYFGFGAADSRFGRLQAVSVSFCKE